MPLIVIVSDPQAAVTPAGSPVAVPIPVAVVVVCVIAVRAVLIHKVGVEEPAVAVLIHTGWFIRATRLRPVPL